MVGRTVKSMASRLARTVTLEVFLAIFGVTSDLAHRTCPTLDTIIKEIWILLVVMSIA